MAGRCWFMQRWGGVWSRFGLDSLGVGLLGSPTCCDTPLHVEMMKIVASAFQRSAAACA